MKISYEPLGQGLTPDGRGGRQDDAAHVSGDLFSFEDGGSLAQVLDAAIGAGTDDGLIDGQSGHFRDGLDVLRQVRAGDLRLHAVGVDGDGSLVGRSGIGLQSHVAASAMAAA